MKNLNSIDEYKQLIQGENVIFLFTADWCPDCRVIEPILPEIEKENNSYSFYSVDRDEYIDLCVELNVFGIPSFVAFNKGEEIGRYVNKERKTQEQIQNFIDGLSN